MQPIRVAVIVRTRDRPEFIAGLFDDLLAQHETAWRVIVVNDQGDRAALDRGLEPFRAQLADRITVVETAAPGGRCAAANLGIAEAADDYVVLHDDDDRWHPDFLRETVRWLDEHPADAGVAVPTEIVTQRRRGDRWVEVDRAPFWAGMTAVRYSELLSVNRMVPIGFLYRRSLHDELGGYDEQLEAAEDWDFYLRVLLHHPVGFIPGRPLAFWTQRPGATGAAGNSMFVLSDRHARDDAEIRDAALREWAIEHGPGVPLFLASLVEREVSRRVDEEFRRRSLRHRVARRLPWLRRLRRRRGRR